MKPAPFFCYLTKEEFLACFALSFLADYAGFEIPTEHWASDGKEGPTDDLGERMLRACRRLSLDDRYEFRGIQPLVDGRIFVSREPVQPENIVFYRKAKLGDLPADPAHAMSVLLRLIEKHNLRTPRSVVREALHVLQENNARALAPSSAEERQEVERITRHRDRSLATVGLRRIPTREEIAS